MNITKESGNIFNPKFSDFKHVRIALFLFVMFILSLTCIYYVSALPASPAITYVSNSTAVVTSANRSTDVKGTITVLTMSVNQQDYKWKAYVGNIRGGLALDDANAKSIYDWTMASVTGQIYATRSSSVSWTNVSCVNDSIVTAEQGSLGMISTDRDNINNTFNYTIHKSFFVATKNISNSTCKSTATYINDTAQTISTSAKFQEILLRDEISSSLIYTGLIDDNAPAYDGKSTYDFQIIVAENESATVPTMYYFYAELK